MDAATQHCNKPQKVPNMTTKCVHSRAWHKARSYAKGKGWKPDDIKAIHRAQGPLTPLQSDLSCPCLLLHT